MRSTRTRTRKSKEQEQEPAAAVAAAAPDPMQGARDLAAAMMASNAAILADARESRAETKLSSGIVPCTGADEQECREWVREIDICQRQAPGSCIDVALRTSRGELRRTLLDLIEVLRQLQDPAPTWPQVRDEVIRRHIGPDFQRRSYSSLMACKRYCDESLATYWRRYLVLLREGLPEMNAADLSRSVVPSLARGAGSESLARRLFRLPNPTMPAITEVVESQIKVDQAMETMRPEGKKKQAMVNAMGVSDNAIQSLTSAIEKITTRISKLEAQGSPHQGTARYKGPYASKAWQEYNAAVNRNGNGGGNG